MKEKYNDIINNQFNTYEETIKKFTLTSLISLGAVIVSIILFFVFGASSSGSKITGPMVIVSFIAAIAAAVVLKKTRDKTKEFVWNSENEFYDNVYAGIIADEIGANHKSEFIKKQKKDIEKYLGEIIEKKSESYSGVLDGKSYKIDFAKGTLISEIITQDKNVVKYKTEEVFTGTDFAVRCNRKVDSDILLTRGTESSVKHSKRKVRMDEKGFPYEVFCEDEVAAYKFLTPGVMSDLSDFNSYYSVNEIGLDGELFNASLNDSVINMEPKIKFSKNVGKLREKYTFEYMYSLAHPQAENFKKLLGSTLAIVR